MAEKNGKKARFDKAVDIIKDAVFGPELKIRNFQGNITIPIKDGEIGKAKVEGWIDTGTPKPKVLTEDK